MIRIIKRKNREKKKRGLTRRRSFLLQVVLKEVKKVLCCPIESVRMGNGDGMSKVIADDLFVVI